MRDLCPRLFPGSRWAGCAVFPHILYVPMQNRSCRISVISLDRARARACVYRCIGLDLAAGRKHTTGEEYVPRGQGTRAKTVLSRESGTKNLAV